VTTTTDGSELALWNTSVLRLPVVKEWVDASTVAWPGTGTGTTRDNGWRMFDGDIATATDTTSSRGWVTVTPTDGSPIPVDLVRVHPRSTHVSRGNGTVLQGSDDGGATWQTFLTLEGMTAAQWYTFTMPERVEFGRVRVLDEHGGNTNLAEVELLHYATGQ
jgi:hypothetical protein